MSTNQNIIESVSRFLGIESKILMSFAEHANKRYSKYYIPKKNGGRRQILHPSKEVKSIQYALKSLLFDDIKVNDIAIAYRYGLESPILLNANRHVNYNYSIRLDFENFFPSIKPEDLFKILSDETFIFTNNEEFENFITNTCFYFQRDKFGLPIGAPSSPIISNIVLKKLDEEIISLANKVSKKSVVTRYADDIVFSTNEKGLCKSFLDGLIETLKNCDSPKLKLNNDKTRFMSRGNKRAVTGLILTSDHKVSIGRNQKRYVRKLVNDYKLNRIDEDSLIYLKGYLSYILDVEKPFFNSLVVKYGDVVNQIRQAN